MKNCNYFKTMKNSKQNEMQPHNIKVKLINYVFNAVT